MLMYPPYLFLQLYKNKQCPGMWSFGMKDWLMLTRSPNLSNKYCYFSIINTDNFIKWMHTVLLSSHGILVESIFDVNYLF